MAIAYLSLGTNLGRKEANLRKALHLLEECGVCVKKVSHIYQTEPISHIKQPDFFNICVEVETHHSPEKLLYACQLVEKEMGRDRTKPKRVGYERPRLIDIDIILYDQVVRRGRKLKIPHAQMHLRKFVLVPLNEIAPHFIVSVQQKTVQDLLNELDDNSIVEMNWPSNKLKFYGKY
ncbi:2-amino-4-hydroxy-6-hydroxymethyldihydropteridine diphosphokinase [Patescibacteria group bacterium]|nr:2-amino-4-hydroxy-6-hydroxymethyldihydropteridine diphosphokinase [Patescibacteria group bacterium]